MTVKRYDCETETRNPGYLGYEVAVMEEWPEGDWVKYEDYDQLQSRCEELEGALGDLIVGVGMEQDGIGSLVGSAYPDQLSKSVRRCLGETDTNLGRLIDKARTALQKGGDDG